MFCLTSTMQCYSATFFFNPNICGLHLDGLKKLNISYFVTYLYQSNFCSQQKMKLALFCEVLDFHCH